MSCSDKAGMIRSGYGIKVFCWNVGTSTCGSISLTLEQQEQEHSGVQASRVQSLWPSCACLIVRCDWAHTASSLSWHGITERRETYKLMMIAKYFIRHKVRLFMPKLNGRKSADWCSSKIVILNPDYRVIAFIKPISNMEWKILFFLYYGKYCHIFHNKE